MRDLAVSQVINKLFFLFFNVQGYALNSISQIYSTKQMFYRGKITSMAKEVWDIFPSGIFTILIRI